MVTIYFIPDIAGVVKITTKTSNVSYVTELAIKYNYSTVPLNYNFIFTCMNMRGNTINI